MRLRQSCLQMKSELLKEVKRMLMPAFPNTQPSVQTAGSAFCSPLCSLDRSGSFMCEGVVTPACVLFHSIADGVTEAHLSTGRWPQAQLQSGRVGP